jgi:hypothetical protein
MLRTKDHPSSALHTIALYKIALYKVSMRGLAALRRLTGHRIPQPDGEEPGHIGPGHIEPSHIEDVVLDLGSGVIAVAVLSLTGFSGIWEQDVANSYSAQSPH